MVSRTEYILWWLKDSGWAKVRPSLTRMSPSSDVDSRCTVMSGPGTSVWGTTRDQFRSGQFAVLPLDTAVIVVTDRIFRSHAPPLSPSPLSSPWSPLLTIRHRHQRQSPTPHQSTAHSPAFIFLIYHLEFHLVFSSGGRREDFKFLTLVVLPLKTKKYVIRGNQWWPCMVMSV